MILGFTSAMLLLADWQQGPVPQSLQPIVHRFAVAIEAGDPPNDDDFDKPLPAKAKEMLSKFAGCEFKSMRTSLQPYTVMTHWHCKHLPAYEEMAILLKFEGKLIHQFSIHEYQDNTRG